MQYEVIVIGGGIVGLASAYQLLKQKPGISLALLEKENKLVRHQTGHNSGVIHSGIYYKPGSYKAKNCIEGYEMLLNFARENDIAYEICGKVIVATSRDEVPQMEKVLDRGTQNGLSGLKKLTADELKDYEPNVNGCAGIYVPQTGIIDYKEVAQTLAEKIRQMGGEIYTGEKVEAIHCKQDPAGIVTNNHHWHAGLIVNCAGLYADKIAAMSGQDTNFRIIPFRGEYYKLREERKHLVKNLIYPVPDPNFPFLGVHFTRMIDQCVEAGPNAVFAFKREGYHKTSFDWHEFWESVRWPGFQKVAAKYWKTGVGEYYRSFSKSAFTHALQRLIPDVQEEDLEPAGAGVRAQACDREGGLIDDFLILEDTHIINVCNAPSPAATSSLSIGRSVAAKILERFN